MMENPAKFGVSTSLTGGSIGPTILGPGLEERGLSALFLAEHTHIPVGSEVPYPVGCQNSAVTR